MPVDRVVAQRTTLPKTTLVSVLLLMAVHALRGRVPEYVRLVTSVASGLLMRAEQWERGQAVIEEHLILPRTFVVTVVAYNPERSFVCVVGLMAGEAVAFERDVEYRFDMACRAFRHFVRAIQRIVGIDVVIELDNRPFHVAVTRFTGLSKMSIVRIVVQMTGYAFHLELIRKRITAVAIVAGQVRMPAEERKIRVVVMVEPGVEPSVGRMAVLALVAAASCVHVVVGMAAETVIRRTGKALVFVAIEAPGFQMFPNQRKPRRIMIELGAGPARGRMAIPACFAHCVFVHVVFTMAIDTSRWCVTVLIPARMAGAAFRIDMSPEQLEVSQRMVERRLVKSDDVGVASLMLCVADRTCDLADVATAAVEASGGSDIIGYLGVTIEAKASLQWPFEGLVAVAAFRLEVCMAFDYRPRHNQRFHLAFCPLSRC